MRVKFYFGKGSLLAYSVGLSVIAQLFFGWLGVLYSRSVNDLSPSEFPLTKIFDSSLRTTFLIGFIQTTIFIFLYWLLVRWVASTAEKAGRSYVAFMIFAIFLPIIAWIVVITFKKPVSNET
jgi:hypothetical protein